MTQSEFQQTVEKLRPQLVERAAGFLADTYAAEDVVQDVLARLSQMHERLRQPIDGIAWVLTRNLCIDHLRRRHVKNERQILANVPVEAETDRERIERMMSIVDELPDMQQTLLRLRHMENMEMADLAALFQMSETAVRKALSRARMAVREEYLKRHYHEE